MAVDKARPSGSAGGFLPVLPPVFALVELAIFAAVIAAEWAWAPFPDLTKLNPHPYWVPILLISLQYGTVSGLLAAALAIGGTVMIGLPEQDIGEAYFNYLVRAWAQPVLWLIVSLLLGGFRMRQIEQRDDLLHQVEELEVQGRLVDAHASALQSRCDRLEREIVTRAKPETDQLLEALARLAAHGGTAEIDAVLDLALPDAEASIFARAGDDLRLVHSHRWPATARGRKSLPGLDAITQTILGEGRPLSILTAGDERRLAGEGVFAVPIIDGEAGPIGMLKIDAAPPAAIGPGTLERLHVLAGHLAQVLPRLAAGSPIANAITAQAVRPSGITLPTLVRRPAVLRPVRVVAGREVTS